MEYISYMYPFVTINVRNDPPHVCTDVCICLVLFAETHDSSV